MQDDQFLSDDLHRVFPLDSLASSHPVYAQVDHPDQISELFDTITYSKVRKKAYGTTGVNLHPTYLLYIEHKLYNMNWCKRFRELP